MGKWTVQFHPAFRGEFRALSTEVRRELAAMALMLEKFGPELGRPHVDTLKGSKHRSMKELRFNAADGVWRVAFSFDPLRNAIVLVAGDKSGTTETRFYKMLIKTADRRFQEHLDEMAR